MPVTPVSTAAEVLVATGHDPVARGSLRRSLVRGWVAEHATAWVGHDAHEDTLYLTALGDPAAVAALVGELAPELPPRQRVTLPRGTPAELPAWLGLDGTDWDFRYVVQPPPRQAGEDLVEPLADDAAVTALLADASPRSSAAPGDGRVRRWVGVRDAAWDGDRLVACAADTSGTAGVGHLSGIAVHPDARGRGLGRAVTAALTRQLLDEDCDLVTLGMYADNTAGRALYDALGFRDEHRFTSGALRVRQR